MRAKLFIIDLMSLAFRCHYAMGTRQFFNVHGFPTSSLFGIARAILSLRSKENPDYIAAVTDTKHPTYRHKLFKGYKADRKQMPEELVEQLPKIYELIDIFNIPLFKKPGFEADDLIASITSNKKLSHLDFFIYSSDKDLMQLVNDHTKIYQTVPQTNSVKIIGINEVYEYFKVYPDQVTCAQSLIGDPVDNVPGVAGIGKVTAAKLLEKFESLDKIYQSLENIKSKHVKSALEKGTKQAYLSKKLVSLEKNIEGFEFNLEHAKVQKKFFCDENHKLDEFFFKCDFKSLRKKYFPNSQIEKLGNKNSLKPFLPSGAEIQNDIVKSDLTDTNTLKDFDFNDSQLDKISAKTPKDQAQAITCQITSSALTSNDVCTDHIKDKAHWQEQVEDDDCKRAIKELYSSFVYIKNSEQLAKITHQLADYQFVSIAMLAEGDHFMQKKPLKAFISLIKADVSKDGNDFFNEIILRHKKNYIIELGLTTNSADKKNYSKTVCSFFQNLLYKNNLNIKVITYDLKTLLHQLTNLNVAIKNAPLFIVEDIMIMSALIEGTGGYLSFEKLAKNYLCDFNNETLNFLTQIKQGAKKSKLDINTNISINNYKSLDKDDKFTQLQSYYCFLANYYFEIYINSYFKINNLELTQVYATIEKPLIVVLYAIERTGVYINKDFLIDYTKLLQQQKSDLQNLIYKATNEKFNINSPKQLSVVLFEKLKLHLHKTPKVNIAKTSLGYSTRESQLLKLLPDPLIENILKYKKICKLLGTYSDALSSYINPNTKKIHTTFNQLGAATGRLSSENPNLQNIPIRSDLGKEIRKAFCTSDPKYCIVSADYSQIELRLLAFLCQDPKLISAFNSGLDVHKSTAAMMLKKPLADVTKKDRELAKAINYGIVYGMGAKKLAKIIKEPTKKAKELIDSYFNQFTKIKKYMEDTVDYAFNQGYTKTYYGRRRYFPSLFSQETSQKEDLRFLNAWKNSAIQGTAADLIKLAMIKLNHDLIEYKVDARIIIQVHDELVLECLLDDLEKTIKIVKNAMENVDEYSVPITVSYGHGNNWLDAH